MKTIQESIVQVIEDTFSTNGNFKTAICYIYSNSGRILVYAESDFYMVQVIGIIYFDFQYDSYTLHITWKGKNIPSQIGRDNYYDFHQTYDSPTRFWVVLHNVIKT